MPKTLLLADDSVTIQKVVGISFANEDVVLLTVDNGDDAVIRAREARPDLVLADVMMPGKDGYEVCETLKADPELRHVPVLLLSGTFEPFDEERARRAGADGHITKPFEAQALVDQVNALLARTATPAAAPAPPAGEATVAVETESAADAFDFFDDEMARTSPAPPGAAPTLLDDGGDALELEAAMEEDAAAAPVAPADAPRDEAADSQATVLFEDEPPAATRRSFSPPPFLGDGFDPESLEAAVPAAAPRSAAPAYEESFDFGFEDGGAAPLGSTPAASGPAAPAEPVVLAPAPAPAFETAPESAPALFEDEAPLAPLVEERHEPLAPVLEDERREPPAPPAPVAPMPPPIPALAAPPPPVPPVAAAPGAPLAVPVVGPASLSEPIQKQLQETLEKIVWEAFGDLSERIVRDVIERVEAVAWEVIPQMAETLIREEIRRLKEGEDA